MATGQPERSDEPPAGAEEGAARALRAWSSAVLAAWVVAPFVVAGTLRWAAGWVHLGALAAGLALHRAWVARRNPAVLARRRALGPGTKPWDLAWNALHWPLLAAAGVAAGLEYGDGGASLPPAAWGGGLALLGAGLALSARAMAVNPFFEATVRLQPGQRVVDAGPYRRLRHPGYAGLVLWALATPLLLRSRAALPFAALDAAWIVLRTALEDATLRRELPGYADYARRVRARLVPGIW